MASKKRDPMLGMSLRERTQERARKARMEAAARRKAAAEQARKDKEAEAARKAAPANERARAQSEGGGMGTPTKPKPKPQPAPASKPKPKPKPQPTQPAASKPKPKPKPKPEQPAAPAKGKSIAERGGPNFKDYPNSKEGLAAYDKAVANWEKTQKSGKRPVRRKGESIQSFRRRLQAYLRQNR